MPVGDVFARTGVVKTPPFARVDAHTAHSTFPETFVTERRGNSPGPWAPTPRRRPNKEADRPSTGILRAFIKVDEGSTSDGVNGIAVY